MQAIASQNQQGIFDKVLRGKDGRLYRVCVEVTTVAGETRGRVLSVVPVCELKGTCTQSKQKYAALPHISVEPPPAPKEQEFHSSVSPFFSELDFFTSQMTRAPAF